MKALLICPDARFCVATLAELMPLSNMSILGKTLVEYWIEHLAVLGAKEVLVLAADRPDQVRACIGDGTRWGLRVTVEPDDRERTLEEALPKRQAGDRTAWLPAPNDVVVMDKLPVLPQMPLFRSYRDWFAVVRALMPHALTPDRIGVREIKPGVWVGLNAHIDGGATLIAPCWIGESAWIEFGATIGPNAVLEREVFIARGAEVSHSVIGPETFVGQFTEVRNSIAWGNTLVNWERDSCLKVPDEFLLCSRQGQSVHPARVKTSVKVRLREYVSELRMSLVAKFNPRR